MKYIWINKKTKEVKQVECSIKEIDNFLKTVSDPNNWRRVLQPSLVSGNKQKGYYNNQEKSNNESTN